MGHTLHVGCKHCVGPTNMLRSKLIKWAYFLRLPKSACHSLGNDLGVWDMLELKRRKQRKQRPFGLEWRAEAHRAIQPFLYEFQKEQNTENRELQLRGAVQKDREKHSEIVREWKRKRIYFSLLKLHTRKINL